MVSLEFPETEISMVSLEFPRIPPPRIPPLFAILFRIAAGKNWARIVYVVVFLTDVIVLPFMLADFWQSLLNSILLMPEAGLQAYALFLLFTQPARSWFLRKWQGNSDMTNKVK